MSGERDLLVRLAEGPVSGDALARAVGQTRAAVWKRIETLREGGVRIDARPGRGNPAPPGAFRLLGRRGRLPFVG